VWETRRKGGGQTKSQRENPNRIHGRSSKGKPARTAQVTFLTPLLSFSNLLKKKINSIVFSFRKVSTSFRCGHCEAFSFAGLECIDCGFYCHKKCAEKVFFFFFFFFKKEKKRKARNSLNSFSSSCKIHVLESEMSKNREW